MENSQNEIKNTVVVLSGKGGVGKSTMAVNLAVGLAQKGFQVGLLDIDIHGPSVPTLLNMKVKLLSTDGDFLLPEKYNDNLSVMSSGFIADEEDQPIIWRGPMKTSFINQMLSHVKWGKLDYLVVDCPPGTGDEPLTILQLLKDISGAVVVTTPQKLSIVDVKKSVNFCKSLNIPILGIIENMSGFICEKCKEVTEIFKSGGGEKMAKDMDVPFLGKVPMSVDMVETGDEGRPFVEACKDGEVATIFDNIIQKVIEKSQSKG